MGFLRRNWALSQSVWLRMTLIFAVGYVSPGRLAQARNAPQGEQMRLPQDMKPYQSPYYIIYTDLSEDEEREVAVHMTRMAEEYHARTSAFSGIITRQLPFYVFKHADDYYEAGGPPGSAGVFMTIGNESRLMAIAIESDRKSSGDSGGGANTGAVTWHVIQHEGFHQFAHAVIGGELPTWINEGLAEYFGESVFTGDSFVTGVIPPRRLERIKEKIASKQFHSVKDMMLMSSEQWNSTLTIDNYDQAWSMAHFLAHGDDGKYQAAFSQFMIDIGRGRNWAAAWENNFGTAEGFEERWKKWWLALPEDPTATLYDQATCATLTSFLARAVSQKQNFKNLDAFIASAKTGELKANPTDWLPPGLLDHAIQSMQRDDTRWSLQPDEHAPAIIGELSDHTRVVGSFTLSGTRVFKVLVDVDDMPLVIEKAKALLSDKKKDAARVLLRDAIRKHPKSPSVPEARKLLAAGSQ